MMNLENAIEIAKNYIAKLNATSEIELILNEAPIEIGEFCYVFSYGNPKLHFAGNAPIIINRKNGGCFVTGTARPSKFYLENYEERGDPHKERGTAIELVRWIESPQTIEAVKLIRSRSNLGLKAARSMVEVCLDGGSPRFEALDIESANRLVGELKNIGLVARQI